MDNKKHEDEISATIEASLSKPKVIAYTIVLGVIVGLAAGVGFGVGILAIIGL